MRILFLAPQPFFRVRGTPINVRNMLTALSRAGHEMDLICYPLGEDVVIPRVRILRVPRLPGIRDVKVGPSLAKIPLDFLMFWKALGCCLRRRYDVIHAVEEAGFFAAWLSRLFRCALIYDMDSFISDQLRYSGFTSSRPLLWLAEKLEQSAMRRSAFVLTVCDSLSDAVRARSPGARVVQIEDAPIEEAFREDAAGADRIRGELGLGAGPVVLYTGNFESYQGVDLLLKAVAIARRARSDLRCVLAGGEADQVARMKELAGRLDLAGSSFFAGKRPMEEMPAFLTLASVLVSPRTQGTNTAMKIYNYMQSGKPIVATRLATHTQALDDTCAVLVRSEPDDLAAGLLRLIEDPGFARALAGAAARRVAERYSLARFKQRLVEAYESLPRRASPRGRAR
jgi:glycosyltransferase involved in cell wall biosynthesis